MELNPATEKRTEIVHTVAPSEVLRERVHVYMIVCMGMYHYGSGMCVCVLLLYIYSVATHTGGIGA